MSRNGVYDVVANILMYDEMLAPDVAYHCAYKAEIATPHLLDIGHFSSAQTLVGNTLIDHRSLSYLPPSQSTLRLQLQRLVHPRSTHHRCICGWHEKGICIEYHQADMVNEAMLRYQRDNEAHRAVH